MSNKLFEVTHSSIELLKGSRPPLGKCEPSGIFRNPDQETKNGKKIVYAEIKIRQCDFTWSEAKDIADQIELFTGWVMLEYSNGEGFWASLNAPPPRQRYSFTLQQADLEIDELKTINGELKAKLDLANKLVAACTTIAMNTAMYTEMGSGQNLGEWLASSTAKDELVSRKAIVTILSDRRWK